MPSPAGHSELPGVFSTQLIDTRPYICGALDLAKTCAPLFAVAYDPETCAPQRPHKPMPLLMAVLRELEEEAGLKGPKPPKYLGLGDHEVAADEEAAMKRCATR